MSEGSFFGEIALVHRGTKRTANVQAATACVIYSLRAEDVEAVAEEAVAVKGAAAQLGISMYY